MTHIQSRQFVKERHSLIYDDFASLLFYRKNFIQCDQLDLTSWTHAIESVVV